jgi:hypothetical protein
MCSHGGCLITLLLVWGTSRHALDTERTPRTNYISMAELSQILLLFYHFHPVHALRYLFEQVYSRNSLFGSQRDQACYFDIAECTSYPRCIIVKLTKCYYRCVILGDWFPETILSDHLLLQIGNASHFSCYANIIFLIQNVLYFHICTN